MKTKLFITKFEYRCVWGFGEFENFRDDFQDYNEPFKV